ncbi:MAG TPA: hypothetical protein VK191_01405 [Symbiobacteriaceae bacterium]|nr:hypothetical protein [Symbiobacteriaceae bacterium]
MARFTSHAVYRFQTRRRPMSGQTTIQESYGLGYLISREEAAARIHGPVYAGHGDFFFRADGTGPGVWVSCLCRGKELVITYLGPSLPRKLKSRLNGTGSYRARPPIHRYRMTAT